MIALNGRGMLRDEVALKSALCEELSYQAKAEDVSALQHIFMGAYSGFRLLRLTHVARMLMHSHMPNALGFLTGAGLWTLIYYENIFPQ